MRGTVEERLMSKVSVGADDCWRWTGSKFQSGYGMIIVSGKQRRAHRVMFEVINGPMPSGMIVCHKCDEPSCVNPNHLFLGTNADNSSDMVGKGRQARGDRNAMRRPEMRDRFSRMFSGEASSFSKLTWDAVHQIREDDRSHSEISRALGVSQPTVTRIKNGKTWKGVV